MRPGLFALVLAASLAAPAAAQNVFFDGRGPSPAPRTVRAYFDREGSLYPPAGVVEMDPAALRRATSLRQYFEANDIARKGLHRWTLGAGAQGVLWAEVQDSVSARLVRSLEREVRSASAPATVVVLIHGFNVDKADSVYAVARAAVQRRAARGSLVFLEVHWDGMAGLNVLTAWMRARSHAPRVGLGLRRVLAQLPDTLPLRVLTHSLGGSVAASALWDRRSDVQRDGLVGADYLTLAPGPAARPFPHGDDLHVAMLVPAIPGLAFAPPPGSLPRGAPTRRIAIGQNAADYAVNKASLGATLFGATSLATAPEDYTRFVAGRFRGTRSRSCLVPVHNRPLVAGDWVRLGIKMIGLGKVTQLQDHDFARYLADPSVAPLLDLLMAADPQPPAPVRCD